MNILIVNCGSSSLSYKVYQVSPDNQSEAILSGKARNVAARTQAEPLIEWNTGGIKRSKNCPLPSHAVAAAEMLRVLSQEGIEVDAAGHRFVHGGDVFRDTVRIDETTIPDLVECLPLAPIHNPNSFSVIEVCTDAMPGLPQFAVFDTAFHAKMPPAAREYALPVDLAQRYGLRKYGFHGLSYQYVSAQAARMLGKPLNEVRLIICHLGTGGSSVCAFTDGKSVDTSMGFSPLAGLVMSTRCGDIDAEVALELIRRGMSADEVSRALNNESGLLGLSGYSSNLAEVIQAAENGNKQCGLAYEVYARRLKFYLGAYTWLLNGADAIVFTDDIGVSSWQLREKVCTGVEAMGVLLDFHANRATPRDVQICVSDPASRTKILVLPTDEEKVILDEVLRLLQEGS
jgi:acetate kinase